MVEVIVPESLQTGSLVEDAQTLIKEENLTEDGVEKEQKINPPISEVVVPESIQSNTRSIEPENGSLQDKKSNDDDNLETGKTNGFARLEKLSNMPATGFKFAATDTYYKLFATPASWFLSKEAQNFAKTGILPSDPLKIDEVKKEVGGGGIVSHMFSVYDRLKDEEKEAKVKILQEAGIPNGVLERVAFGVGTIPIEVLRQLPALIVTKGKAAPSFAVTEAFFASEDGPLAATKAAAYGYTIGKVMDVISPLPLMYRMPVMGTVGFGLSGPELEDRIVGAALFGGMSFFGVGRQRAMYDDIVKDPKSFKPKKMTKEIKVFEDMINGRLPEAQKQFDVQVTALNKIQKELSEVQTKLTKDKNNNELILKESELNLAKNAQVNIVKDFDAQGFTLNKNKQLFEKFRDEIIDERPVNIAKRDMFEMTGSNNIMVPKYKDAKPSIFRGVLTKELAYKRFPILNIVNTRINIMRQKIDRDNEVRLDDPTKVTFDLEPKFTQTYRIVTEQAGKTTNLKKLFFSEREAKAYFDTKLGNAVKPFSKIKKAEEIHIVNGKITPATDLVRLKTGHNSVFYHLDRLPIKKQIAVKDAIIKNEEYIVTGKKTELYDSNFNIKDSALKDEFKLDANQAAAFKQIRQHIDGPYDEFLQTLIKIKGTKADTAKRPGHFPHRWNGRYVVRVGSKKDNKLLYAEYAPNKKIAKQLKEELEKKDPDTTVNYRLNDIYQNKEGKTIKVDEDIQTMAHSHINYATLKDLPPQVREVIFKYKRDGLVGELGAISRPRREGDFVKGFKGTAPGKKGLQDFKEVIESYIRGVNKKKHMLEFEDFFNKFFYEPITDAKIYNKFMDRDGHLVKDTFSISNSYPNLTRFAETLREDALGRTPAHLFSKLAQDILEPTGILLRDVDNFFGKLNAYTAFRSLFFWNGRFMLAQGIQPSQIVTAKLFNLAERTGNVISPYRAWSDSFKDMMFVTKETSNFTDALMKYGTVNKKFMNEFFGESQFRNQKVRVEFKKALENGDYTGVAKKVAFNLSGLNVTGRVEQYSRLQAALMFRNLFKQMGMKETEKMYAMSARMADMYMVRYDIIDRARFFTERGLGVFGKLFGLFKTWMQNWYAQGLEHTSHLIRRGEYKGFGAFVVASTLTAGVTGTIGINTADTLIQGYNYMRRDNVKTLSQRLYEMGLPDELLFGFPSAIGIDTQATLGVPNLNPLEIFSTPGYDIILEDVIFDVLPVIFSEFTKVKPTTEERRDAYKVLLPTPFHAVFELAFQKEGDSTYFDKDGKAKIDRDFNDWFARFLSSYSVEEAYFGKLSYQITQLERNTQYSYSFLVKKAADLYFHTGEIPEFMFIMATDDYDKLPIEFLESVKRQMSKRFDDTAEKLTKKGADYDVLRDYIKQRTLGYETKESLPPSKIFKGDEYLFR
mgnify:FL=1|tara:strand:+ start:2583 stop:6824 length:4242 start_codon:yes stop_codon:yes gene_type:complete